MRSVGMLIEITEDAYILCGMHSEPDVNVRQIIPRSLVLSLKEYP